DVAYDRPCMHEFVLTAARQKKQGSSALDISKALLDEGFHSPTVYFPLIVPEALMIEPTETEPKETLDAFAAAMIRIAERIEKDPASERVDQAHYGERLVILGREDEWLFVQGPDHYFGWIWSEHLDEVAAPERRIVGVVAADVRSAPTDGAPVIDRLPVGSPLAIQERQGEWMRVSADGWLAFRDTVDIAQLPNRFPRPGDLMRTA